MKMDNLGLIRNLLFVSSILLAFSCLYLISATYLIPLVGYCLAHTFNLLAFLAIIAVTTLIVSRLVVFLIPLLPENNKFKHAATKKEPDVIPLQEFDKAVPRSNPSFNTLEESNLISSQSRLSFNN